MKTIIGLLLILLITACSSAPVIQTVEVTRVVPQNVEITKIVRQTMVVTKIITRVITATPKPATVVPSSTRTTGPTDTPVPTLPPEAITATAQYKIDLILLKDHTPGVYLVNVDIGPGVWRNSSTRDDCYWKRTDKYGEIIDNYFGFGGGTIYISPTDFQVELNEECGIWTWLSPP